MAAFSESPAISMRAPPAAREHLGGQPLALGADEQRELRGDLPRGPRSALGASGRAPQLAWERARSLGARAIATRRSPPCSAHRLGPWGSAQPGPERDGGGAEGVRGAQDRADVAGVTDAVEVDAQGPQRRPPALLIDGERARARPKRGGARARRLDLMEALAAQPGSPATRSPRARPPRRVRRRDEVLALGDEAGAAIAAAPGDQAASAFSRGLWGRRSGHLGGVWVLRNEKGAVPERSDAREAVVSVPCRGGAVLRQPTPRGRPRQNVGRSRRRARRCPRGPCGRARCRQARGRA